MLIDANCFLGPWPFLPLPERSGRELAAHLGQSGVNQALVSHLAAAFLPEPMPANRRLWATTRNMGSLVPTPVINPALASWRSQLSECLQKQPGLRAIRLLPAFHNYSASNPRLKACMQELAQGRIAVVLQVRVEDERNRYFGLKVAGFPESSVSDFLRRFSAQTILCTGLYISEIRRLAAKHGNFIADVSFAESLTTLEDLCTHLPAQRLVFGSGCPILSVSAQVAKIRQTGLPTASSNLIAAGNIRRFLNRHDPSS